MRTYRAQFNEREWQVEADSAESALAQAVKIICPGRAREHMVTVRVCDEFVVRERVFGLGGETWEQEHGRFATRDEADEAAIELEAMCPGIWVNVEQEVV